MAVEDGREGWGEDKPLMVGFGFLGPSGLIN